MVPIKMSVPFLFCYNLINFCSLLSDTLSFLVQFNRKSDIKYLKKQQIAVQALQCSYGDFTPLDDKVSRIKKLNRF